MAFWGCYNEIKKTKQNAAKFSSENVQKKKKLSAMTESNYKAAYRYPYHLEILKP